MESIDAFKDLLRVNHTLQNLYFSYGGGARAHSRWIIGRLLQINKRQKTETLIAALKDKEFGFLPAKRGRESADLDEISFVDLEEKYQERKRIKTTIDLTNDDSDDDNDGKVAAMPDGSGIALQNQAKQNEEHAARLIKVKKEKDIAREFLKDAKESLEDTKEDLEDANELVQQQTLTVDIWQGRFDELAQIALQGGIDLKLINDIRYRPLSSGR